MKRSQIITATVLILLGGILFVCIMTSLKWDFTKLSNVKYETITYEITSAYKNISVTTKEANVEFIMTGSDKTSVVCFEKENTGHSVSVKDGALVIEASDNRVWYDHLTPTFEDPKITVYIPKGDYSSLFVKSNTGSIKNNISFSDSIVIKTSTGGINLENISSDKISLSVSTGRISASGILCNGKFEIYTSTGTSNLDNVKCRSLLSDGSTGNIVLKNVIAEEKLDIERSTGNVIFDSCDAKFISVETDTGDVTGSLLSGKVFVTETNTGRTAVPETTSGGKCEIETDTGDIVITVK